MSTPVGVVATPVTTPRRAWWALAVLMLPVLLVAVDATVLASRCRRSPRIRPAGTQLWIIDIYSLVLAALLVSMGSIGDRIGRRRLLMIGSSGFAVVSAVAAFAPTAEALIVSRAVLGVFGAMLMPSTLSLIRNIFAEASARRLAIAIWASCFTAGSRGADHRRLAARALPLGLGVSGGRAGPGAAAGPRPKARARIEGPLPGPIGPGQRDPVTGRDGAVRLGHQDRSA